LAVAVPLIVKKAGTYYVTATLRTEGDEFIWGVLPKPSIFRKAGMMSHLKDSYQTQSYSCDQFKIRDY